MRRAHTQLFAPSSALLLVHAKVELQRRCAPKSACHVVFLSVVSPRPHAGAAALQRCLLSVFLIVMSSGDGFSLPRSAIRDVPGRAPPSPVNLVGKRVRA